MQSSIPAAKPTFHIPFRSEFEGHEIPSLISKFSAMNDASHVRAIVSLRRYPARNVETRYTKDVASSSKARLRGGGGQRQASRLGWLKRAWNEDQTLDEGEGKMTYPEVMYKGRQIGPPQPVSALNVLPPASGSVKHPQDNLSLNHTVKLPPSSYDLNGNHLPTPSQHNMNFAKSPSLPPPPALLATPSRPATTNPFAGIYGNPNVARVGLPSPHIDYGIAGSLVDRPSALDGSQTGYGQVPALFRRNPLNDTSKALKYTSGSQDNDVKPFTRKMRVDRMWYALFIPPPGERAPEPPPKDDSTEEAEQAEDESFDTEAFLRSLRPERLSLYHVGPPGHPMNDAADIDHESAHLTEWPTQAIASHTRRSAHDNNSTKATEEHSIHTCEWDLQSCNNDDLGVDKRLEWQEQLTKCNRRHQLPREQRRQENDSDNNQTISGLSEEYALTSESIFYAGMIDIVQDYHEQLQSMVKRAYEAGEMSEDQWVREKWRHRTAMDRKLRAMEDMSGYKILTDENDIKRSIKQPTGYAIYSSLYKIWDPETWQRIFEPTPALLHPRSFKDVLRQYPKIPENSLIWLARKAGRALRFMLAVPDDPELKTYTSRHSPTGIVKYQSRVGILGSNIPSRPQHMDRCTMCRPAPIIEPSLSSSFVPAHDHPRPGTQTEWSPKILNDAIRVTNNTKSTGTTLDSPLEGRYVRAPRSRGYDQGAFVTVLNRSIVSSTSEKTMAGYGAGRMAKECKATDEESNITLWPEADC